MQSQSMIKKIKTLLAQNRLDESKRLLEEVALKNGIGVHISYLIALYHFRKQEYSLAIPHLQAVIERKEKLVYIPESYKILAYCLLKEEQYWKAEEVLYQVSELYHSDHITNNMRAYTYFCLKRIDEAVELYKEVLASDKQNKTALNGLSYCMTEYYDRPQDAVDMLSPVIDNDPRLLDTLGWAYYKLGNTKKAEFYVKQAFEQMPAHKEIKQHITVIFTTI